MEFAAYARNQSRFLINDIHYPFGGGRSGPVEESDITGTTFTWLVSPAATVALARNLAGIIKSLYGKASKSA